MKIAVVTCYQQNDYVRARTLRTAFAACPGVDTLVIRNRHKSLLRYPEVALRLCKARLIDRPDAYVITFRGYEMLLFMVLTLVRKPIIFDELVNFTEWMEEHGRLKSGTLLYRAFRYWYSWLAGRSRIILADTDAHARYSAMLNKLSIKRYRTIPVGTDEAVFHPQKAHDSNSGTFTVVYYGSMLALHGLRYILEAALLLKSRPEIHFRLIGGKREVAKACAEAAAKGAKVSHEPWLPFEQLPEVIRTAGLTLGGPFGDTLQSQFVITGKAYQALAAAAPVLIGANKVSEDFHDKVNCLMVPQADPVALAEAITWAADHPKELSAIGHAGYQLYDQHFSQKVVNGLIQKLVAEL